MNECTSFAGHFDSHDNAPVQFGVQHSIQKIYGYHRCNWMPRLGKYLPHIARVDTMVINFGSKIELWRCEIAFQSYLAFKRHTKGRLLSSLKRQAASKGQMSRLKPKGSAFFLAIKRWQWTKNAEETYHQWSSLKSGWSWPPIAVKLF